MKATKNTNVTPDVTINVNNGSNLRLRITGRLWDDNKPRFIALQLTDTPASRVIAMQRQLEVQIAINDGTLDPTLERYRDWNKPTPKYHADNRVMLFAMWKDWCKYREPLLAASTYKQKFSGTFSRSLDAIGDMAINSDNAKNLRDWLIENRNKSDNVWLLSELEKACDRAINDRWLYGGNPFLGMSTALATARNRDIDVRSVDQIITDLSKRIHYTPQERDAILGEFATRYPHYWLFTYFRFFTGCRFEESVGIQWGDITEDCKVIIFRRSHSGITRETKATKTGKTRRFNPTQQLTDLLIAHRAKTYTGDDSAIVFTNQGGNYNGMTGKPTYIALAYYKRMWNRINRDLLAQGIIEQVLTPKHTRHTLSNLAGLAGIDSKTLAQQMGHSEKIMQAHYRDKSASNETVIDTHLK